MGGRLADAGQRVDERRASCATLPPRRCSEPGRGRRGAPMARKPAASGRMLADVELTTTWRPHGAVDPRPPTREIKCDPIRRMARSPLAKDCKRLRSFEVEFQM